MSDETVGEDGRLLPMYLPAVYLDSSVLIDYWITEGAEVEYPPELTPREAPHVPILRELLNSDRRYAGMIAVRKALLGEELKATAVCTALAQLELIEWRAEATFKTLAAQAAGAPAIQKKSKKDIGDLLRKVLEQRRQEAASKTVDRSQGSTGLELLAAETWTDGGFARAHGLRGVAIADLRRFKLMVHEAWDVPQLLAYLQVGMADIMHLLAAVHLGCTWFASFDSDFERCREHIQDGLHLKLLRSPEEILATLRGGDETRSGPTTG
jgi:hypothetical protein